MPSEPSPPQAPKTWLIVGLGNPGPEYERTPHNLGFCVIDRLAAAHRIRVNRPECLARVGIGQIEGAPVILAQPQTYMNSSGSSVRALLDAHGLTNENLLLVYDELALPWASIRIRPHGSSAGHNGVEDVINRVGGNFARVRLGIHPGRPVGDGAAFVLAPMRRVREKEVDELLDLGCRAVESVIAEGVAKTMAKYNRRAQGSTIEDG